MKNKNKKLSFETCEARELMTIDLSVNDPTVTEGGIAALVINSDERSSRTYSIQYETRTGTAGSADFEAKRGWITMPANATSVNIPIQTIDDSLIESTENFSLRILRTTRGRIRDNSGRATILDNDTIVTPPPTPTPQLTITDKDIIEGNDGISTVNLTVNLSIASTNPVTVNYTTVNGTANTDDFSSNSNTLTFSPGETSKTIGVVVNGDTLVETDELFTVVLSGATNATISDNSATVRILNDDNIVNPPPTNDAKLIYSNPLSSLSDLARVKTVTAQGDSTKFNGEERQYYLDYNANGGNIINGRTYQVFSIVNGGLQINAMRAEGLPKPLYSSDAPNDFISGAFSLEPMLYGYVSADMRFTSKQLQWGAFWLTEYGAPMGTSEIDIAEQWAESSAYGTVASNLLKFDPRGWEYKTQFDMDRDTNVNRVVMDRVGAEQWHNYALEWTPTLITVYVDGVKKWSYDPPIGFNKAMVPMFNLATLGSEGSMGVKNIQVYDKRPF